jgi:hypothetical protein
MSTTLRLWCYEDECDAELSQWDAQFILLRAKAEQADGDVRMASHKALEALRHQQEAVKAKQLELKSALEEAREGLAGALDKARMDLRASFCRLAAKLG